MKKGKKKFKNSKKSRKIQKFVFFLGRAYGSCVEQREMEYETC